MQYHFGAASGQGIRIAETCIRKRSVFGNFRCVGVEQAVCNAEDPAGRRGSNHLLEQ